MGKKTSAPPVPDYKSAAEATAKSNLEAARSATEANRVNQVTPWGSLTYSQSPRQFNQSGYDSAMQAYNANQQASPLQTQAYSGKSLSSARSQSEYQQIQADMARQQINPQQQLQSPNRNDFYTGNPDSGWTAEVKLDPMQQQLLDQQNKTSLAMGGLQDSMMNQVSDSMGNPIKYSDLPQVQGMDLNKLSSQGSLDYSKLPQIQAVNRDNMPTIQGDYAKTGYDAIMSRLNPQLDEQRRAFDTQMANQGITLGSEAYNNAFKNQSQSSNDARIQAGLQGIGIGQQQQQQQMALQNQEYNQRLGMFNSQLQNRGQMANEAQNMYQAQFANRGQSFGEQQGLFNSQMANQHQQYGLQSALHDRPLNQLNALRAGSQVQAPSFINAPQQATTGGVDYNQVAGLQNQYNMGLYNSKVGQNNNLMSTLGGLGGAAMGLFSDERLKINIQRIGTHDTLGIGIYKYEKFGVPEIGVLAQELEKVLPDAVSLHTSGFKVVDLGAL